MPATSTGAATWSLEGGVGLEGDAETTEPEVFGVAGVLARPDGGPEAIVVAVGGNGHDAIVATRDHVWAIASGAADMPKGETWIFNSKAFVRLRADGTIELGRPDGSFEELATKSHVHNATTGSAPLVAPSGGGPVTGITGPAIVNAALRGIAKNAKAES